MNVPNAAAGVNRLWFKESEKLSWSLTSATPQGRVVLPSTSLKWTFSSTHSPFFPVWVVWVSRCLDSFTVVCYSELEWVYFHQPLSLCAAAFICKLPRGASNNPSFPYYLWRINIFHSQTIRSSIFLNFSTFLYYTWRINLLVLSFSLWIHLAWRKGSFSLNWLNLHSTSNLLTLRDLRDIKLPENDINAKNPILLSEIQVLL